MSAGPEVVVVDDDLSVCKALVRLLSSAGVQARAYQSGQQFLAHYAPESIDCLLLDIEMPDINGLTLQDRVQARGDAPPIIFLTGHNSVPECARAFKHGAVDFLNKPVDMQQLLGALREAKALNRRRRENRAQCCEMSQRLARLTPRETEVMKYVVAGWLNKQIAAELGIVEKTIKVHRARVMEKMQAGSLAELVLLASRAGLVACPSLVPS